jgi:hypothetical protein
MTTVRRRFHPSVGNQNETWRTVNGSNGYRLLACEFAAPDTHYLSGPFPRGR